MKSLLRIADRLDEVQVEVNPVRIAQYAEYADLSPNGSKDQVAALLAWAQTYKGRSYSLSDIATSSEVATGLSIDQHDLLLVHDQPNAPAGELALVGAAWQATITTYLQAGGAVVVLASADGADDMPALIVSSGLLSLSAVHSVSNAILLNNAPADAVGGIGVAKSVLVVRHCRSSDDRPRGRSSRDRAASRQRPPEWSYFALSRQNSSNAVRFTGAGRLLYRKGRGRPAVK